MLWFVWESLKVRMLEAWSPGGTVGWGWKLWAVWLNRWFLSSLHLYTWPWKGWWSSIISVSLNSWLWMWGVCFTICFCHVPQNDCGGWVEPPKMWYKTNIRQIFSLHINCLEYCVIVMWNTGTVSFQLLVPSFDLILTDCLFGNYLILNTRH